MEKFKKEKIFSSMAGFIPRKIVFSKIADTSVKDYEILHSSLLYSDISGFTAMSEKLASIGKEGSEEVNKIINNFFATIIQIINKWDGDIYRFGGDSILSFFPEKSDTLLSSLRAINAATEIVNFVKRHETTKTKVGSFKIKIHSGLVKGEVYLKDLKTDFFLGGALAHNLIKIIDYAGPGEIVVDGTVRNELKDVRFVPAREDFWKYKTMKKVPAVKPSPVKSLKQEISLKKIEDKFEELMKYIPEWLYKRIELKPFFDQRDGEHRKVAVVFLHFAGMPYETNPGKASSMINNFYSIVKQTVEKYDGWLNAIDVYKDCARIMAVFGFPKAYEDDEKRAALFTYELLIHPGLEGMKMKAGVNVGSVFAAPVGSEIRREYAVMGDAVNLAARLADSSDQNTITVSEAIFNKTFSLFEYESLGEKEYKGKKRKIASYKLLQKRQVEKTILTKWLSESEKLVGRNKEIQIIKEKIALVKKSKGQIVGITGEAGIGKSRLTQEIIKELGKEKFPIFKGSCVSYGSAFSYHPWVEILADFFNILPTDSVNVRKTKIRNKAVAVDKKLVEWLPVIGEIMGVSFPETSLTKFLDAKIKKQRVFDISFDFMKYTARSKPVCIIIEDLHWADTASVELVNYIGRNIENKPFFFVLVYRPIKRKEEFIEKDFSTELLLKELSKDDSLELVKNLLNIKDISKDFRELIIEKSQGNPFYIEELVKSLIEQGYIIEEKGTWKFTGDIKKLALPDTVEAVILSRIDRLDLPERNVLQVASVLGREFDEFLIKGIYPETKLLNSSLRNLQHLDLIRQEKGEKQMRYIFKHIMTREVAYDTLAYARKRELHQKTGGYIEDKLKDRREEFLGLLSYHFYQGEDYDKSLLYSVEAGERAKKVYANEEAIEFFTRAIDSYEKLEGKL